MGRKTRPRRAARGKGQNATERAYSQLKRQIQSDALEPGETILQPKIAKMLGVSRTPAREAIIRLECERLVKILPRRGFLVRPVTIREICEICECLSVLEAVAVRSLARNGISQPVLGRLENCLEAMEAAAGVRDMRRWVRVDEQFHLHLVRAAENKELARVTEGLWDRLRRMRYKTASLREAPSRSNREHASIVSAIRRKRPEQAFVLHEQHHIRFRDTIQALFKGHGLEQI